MKFKYATYMVGLILFTGLVYILLNIAAKGGEAYSSTNYETYQNMTNEYDYVDQISLDEDNSTLRQIQTKLKSAKFTSLSAAVGVVENAIDGAKLLFNSVETTKNVVNTVSASTDGYVDPYWWKIFLGIISTLIVLVVLYMMMRYNAES